MISTSPSVAGLLLRRSENRTQNRKKVSTTFLDESIRLAASGDDDLALGLEPLGDVDDLLLGVFDVGEPNWTHGFQVLLQEIRRALGDVAEDLVLDLVRRRLEGDDELVVRDFLEKKL